MSFRLLTGLPPQLVLPPKRVSPPKAEPWFETADKEVRKRHQILNSKFSTWLRRASPYLTDHGGPLKTMMQELGEARSVRLDTIPESTRTNQSFPIGLPQTQSQDQGISSQRVDSIVQQGNRRLSLRILQCLGPNAGAIKQVGSVGQKESGGISSALQNRATQTI